MSDFKLMPSTEEICAVLQACVKAFENNGGHGAEMAEGSETDCDACDAAIRADALLRRLSEHG